MWDCFSEPGFLAEVGFRLVPSILAYICCLYLFKFASDWF
jgi:hypothetical protein